MENITSRPEGQGPFELLIDPVYGPNSKHFWPGSCADATEYALSAIRISPYVPGNKFLEVYAETFSGVLDYLESTDYPDQGYCDTLYNHFYSLYSNVKSWERTTLFVSAVYRSLFDEMCSSESRILELRTDLDYESVIEPYLKESKSEVEAIVAAYGTPFKEADKGERDLSLATCRRLISLILARDTDLLLVSELVKMLRRTNIVARHQKQLKEGLLSDLEDPYPIFSVLSILKDETRKDLHKEKLVLALSLFEIEPKAAEKVVNEALSSLSYEPIISLIREHPLVGRGWPTNPSKRGFASDQTSAYYIGPSYTATDYINDLILSEEAYNRIFEEVRDSAAEWGVTSVLMSFEEEAGKLGQLAYLEMIQELFNENTGLINIVDPVAKSLDEDNLLFTEDRHHTKIFDKIDKKIIVPPEARKRILEICKKHGIPDNAALAEEILSVASLTGSSALEKLVKAFASLLALAVASIVSVKGNVAVVGPIHPRYTNQVEETGGYLSEKSDFRYRRPRKATFQSLGQRQTNRVLRQSTVASFQKRSLDPQKSSFLKTVKDKEKYNNTFIHGSYDRTTKEITMEGSCGPAHLLQDFRKGPVKDTAKAIGYTVRPVEFDHSLSSRNRQGLNRYTVREDDISIVEAIHPLMHRALTNKGSKIYLLPDGIVSIDEYLEQMLAKRIEVFKSPTGQAAIKKIGNVTIEDYIACSERASTWNRKDFRSIADQQRVDYKCVQSILYPNQIYNDADIFIKRMHAHINLTSARDLKETQALLTETIEQVSTAISLLDNFQASSQGGLPGVGANLKKLVFECNQLVDLANSQYSNSRFTGSPLRLPSRGKIISLEKTIEAANNADFNQQWRLHGAKPGDYNPSAKSLKECTELILSTNGLVDEPMRSSLSQSMRNLMGAQLTGENYDELLDAVYR